MATVDTDKSIPLNEIMRLSDVASRMRWSRRTVTRLKRQGLADLLVVIGGADHINTSELWDFLRRTSRE